MFLFTRLCRPAKAGRWAFLHMKTAEGGRADTWVRPYNLFPGIGREAEGGLPYIFREAWANDVRPYKKPPLKEAEGYDHASRIEKKAPNKFACNCCFIHNYML